MNTSSKHTGFSLLEVMVTLSIVAILSAIAIPSFEQTIRKNRANSAAEALIASWNLARAESMASGGQVSLATHAACAAKKWQCGWHIQNGGTTIQSIEGQRMLTITNNKTNSLTFNRYGRPNIANHQFLIQPERQPKADYSDSVVLCVNAGGIIRKITNIQGAPSCSP